MEQEFNQSAQNLDYFLEHRLETIIERVDNLFQPITIGSNCIFKALSYASSGNEQYAENLKHLIMTKIKVENVKNKKSNNQELNELLEDIDGTKEKSRTLLF